MTLPEALASIEVHNGGMPGGSRAAAQAADRRESKKAEMFTRACEELNVLPQHLAAVDLSRVVDAIRRVSPTPIPDSQVPAIRDAVAAFAASAQPEEE